MPILFSSPFQPGNPPAYVGREPEEQADSGAPTLVHTLHQEGHSVLSLAADNEHIFSGSQGGGIYVWDRQSFAMKGLLRGHTGAVLALETARHKGWLFSSSADSTVRVWSMTTLEPLYVIHPFMDIDAGDLYSLAYSPPLQTLYIGCQNTSLQWIGFTVGLSSCLVASEMKPHRPSKFFDSVPQPASRPASPPRNPRVPVLQIPASNVVDFAHYGYIYCMAISPSPLEFSHDVTTTNHLLTGSGDESVKLWKCESSGPTLQHTFEGCDSGVLALVTREGTAYAGCQDGYVMVCDLETKTRVRIIIGNEGVDILALSMLGTDLYVSFADGSVQRWSASFDCSANWKAHDGIVLSSLLTSYKNTPYLLTGASDNDIKIWRIDQPMNHRVSFDVNGPFAESDVTDDTMVHALTKLVSIPSVSSVPLHREDCRQAAIWLHKCVSQLGAQSTMISAKEGTNPLVLATFRGSELDKPRKRILFYGHYDVFAAPRDGWSTEPFTVEGKDGYIYGRGVTDNKGPILAIACAASTLLARRALDVDLVFLAEGEEEAGSDGFEEAVRKHKDQIGPIDCIIVSNSTWIGEDHPCITYGLRGVIHATIKISSGRPDLHSGVDGGAVIEPMSDMIRILGMLSRGQEILIPDFYESVSARTEEERKQYDRLFKVTGRSMQSLASRWQEPSLSIHGTKVSGPGNSTIIPSQVETKISIRIVPKQCVERIAKSLKAHVEETFRSFQSPNQLTLSIDRTADWWLGNLQDPFFQAMETAIENEWGCQPLRIREGGSIPSVPFLEKEFGCHALHLPMGQSSDRAHLENERISLMHLKRGKAVVERFFELVAKRSASTS